MTRATHTSTPWEVHEDYPGDSLVIHGACDDQGCIRIAEIVSDDDKADAHLIVRAVNAHEELLEALRLAYDLLDEGTLLNERRKIKQAIAKAEGK